MRETSTPTGNWRNNILGLALISTTVFVLLREWVGGPFYVLASDVGVLSSVGLASWGIRWTRKAFVATGIALSLVALLFRADWQAIVMLGVERAAFIAAFFIALATLRIPSAISPAIERCGIYLTEQPPGRRYLALTIGGHVFALILNYGAITLLGSLVEVTTRHEADEERRRVRIKRMLLAIQRGFVSSICWSPLGFSMALTVTIIPGASWSGAVGYALVSSGIVIGVGWALDTIFKPRLKTPSPPPKPPTGRLRDVTPLLILLLALGLMVGTLEIASGLPIIAVVMLVVPLMSLGWLLLQGRGTPGGPVGHASAQARGFIFREAPSYASEVVLLVMAGYIGAVGGELLSPFIHPDSLNLEAVPGTLILISLIWLMPLTGQIGMNPILAISLFAPFLAGAGSLGIDPNLLVVAITGGWAISGATSPYTATVLLIGRMGGVPPYHVGWKWNGAFTLWTGLALSAWVALIANI